MRRTITASLSLFLLVGFILAGCQPPAPEESGEAVADVAQTSAAELSPKEALGRLLFFDPMLSTPPGQSCAHCHSPTAGFGDPNHLLPVSRGVHPDRYGNRDDLTASYAAFIPPLEFDEEEGLWVGGLFWDGRASSLAEQAKGPPLNPLEMANPDVATVVASIREGAYRDDFLAVYGEDALDDVDQAYEFMADAIAAFEMTEVFSPFDSKYDLYLAGEVELTPRELSGLALFEDETKGNCAACHPSQPSPDGTPPLFTDYTYDNLGTPRNPELPFYAMPQEFNPDGVDYVDLGLGPVVGDPELNGFIRVPTLRNVGVTSPYMHNSVFKNLYQVVAFYNSRDVKPWPEAEVPANVNREELGDLGLTPEEIEDIVAFMLTLTDGYEGGN
jgi:cytochrome c peroxidase